MDKSNLWENPLTITPYDGETTIQEIDIMDMGNKTI
jgi:hypothetical protein